MGYKKSLFFIGLFFFVIMSVSGIYALNESISDTESPVSTSYVDINLSSSLTNKNIMPGDVVYWNTFINNLGIDCYVRTKIDYIVKDDYLSVSDNFSIDSSKWKKIGDYFYYDSILKENASLQLFNNFLVTSSLDNNYANEEVVFNITVEAIQTKNFTPDYSSSSPWKEYSINKRINRTYSINQVNSYIVYENGADKYLTINSNFFSELNNLVPGDVISEQIEVENLTNKNVDIYYSITSDNLNIYTKELFESLRLVITDMDNNVLYDGALLDYKKHYLKTYEIKDSDLLTFTISFPPHLDNDYSIISTNVVWTFSIDNVKELPENPKTMDEGISESIKVFILSFIGLIITLIIAKIKTLNIEKKKEGI